MKPLDMRNLLNRLEENERLEAAQANEEAFIPKEVEAPVDEAVGESAECFYELQDDFAGGECPSGAHKAIIDEMVRFMTGDQIQEFCDDFRRHYDMNDMND